MKSKIILSLFVFLTCGIISKSQVGINLEKFGVFANDSIITDSILNVAGQVHAILGVSGNVNELVDTLYNINDSTLSVELESLVFSLKSDPFDTLYLNEGDSIIGGRYLLTNSTLPLSVSLVGNENTVFVFYVQGDLNIISQTNFQYNNINKSNVYWIVDDDLEMHECNIPGIFICGNQMKFYSVNWSSPTLFSFKTINFYGVSFDSRLNSYLNTNLEYLLPPPCTSVAAQCEFVYNSSFEDISSVPQHHGQFYLACSWLTPGSGTSPELFNTASPNPAPTPYPWSVSSPISTYGNENPRTGNSFAGIAAYSSHWQSVNYREYISQRLTQPLIQGKNYYISFWISLAEHSYFSTDRIGAYLSSTAPLQIGSAPLTFIPQIESASGSFLSICNGYVKIGACYTAVGGEEYITIGNFHNDASTALSIAGTCGSMVGNFPQASYYFIDDVSIKSIPTPQPLQYTTNCGVPIQIGPSITPCEAIIYHGWTWSPTIGLSASNVQNPTLTLTTPGVHHYTLTWNSSFTGCPLVYNVTITIPGTPATINSNGTVLGCAPSSKTLTALPSGGSYLWENLTTGVILGNSQSININQPGIYEVTVTQNGCISTATVTITGNPPINLSIVNPSPLVCSGQSVTLSTNCATCVSYSWTPGGGTSSQNVVNPLSGLNTYTVTGTDNYGCTASASTTVQVFVPQLPIITGPVSHCSDDVITLTISNWNSSYDNLYAWTTSGNGTIVGYPDGNNHIATIQFPNDDGGSVTVTYGLPGCQQTTTYFVQQCCKGGNTTLVLADGSTQDDITTGPSTSATGIAINGVFTVNRNFSFSNCGQIQMAPGSKIIVEAGVTLSITGCEFLPTDKCCKMWKGIELESGPQPYGGGIIYFIDSKISQAEYAITANRECVVVTDYAEFFDNYVGIYFKSSFGITNIDAKISRTSFYSVPHSCSHSSLNGNFVDPYPGQTTLIGQRPYAGILANGVSALFSSLYNVTFNDLSNGIIATNVSALNINNCSFTNMIVDPVYAPLVGNFNGCGVRATNCGIINFRGYGGQFPSSQFVLKNCNYGFYLSGCTGRIWENSSDFDVRTGIYITKSTKLSIYDNSICARVFGINTFFNPNYATINIYNNQFRNSQTSTWAIGGNIFLNEGLLTRITVRDNDLFVNRGLYGIFGNLNQGTKVIDHNDVEMTWLGSSFGIRFIGGRANTISCNYVNSVPGYGVLNQTGIDISNSPNITITDNIVDHQRYGMRFNGASGSSLIATNTMNTHQTGLGIYFSGNIGTQPNSGNIWAGSTYVTGAWLSNPIPARRNANLFEYELGLTNGNFPTSTNTPPSSWFQGIVNPDLVISCDPKPAIALEIRPEDYIIATNQLDDSIDFPQQNYECNRFLFDKLQSNPDLLLNDPILSAYYNQHFNSSIGQFSSVSVDIENALKWATVYINVYEANLDMMSVKNDSLQLVDSLLNNDPSNQILSLILENLKNDLIDLTTSNENILSVTSEFSMINVENAENENESLIDQEVYESNEIIVNNIYLNTLAIDNFTLSNEQILELENIIFQCPFVGGNAVYRARSLYTLINDSLDYDDYDLCVFQGVAPRLSNFEKPVKILVYPNPASSQVTVSYSIPEVEFVYFKIIDQLSKTVLETKLDPKENSISIDCLTFKAGLYTYQIISDGSVLKSGLLSVVK